MSEVIPWESIPPESRRSHHPSVGPEDTFPGQCAAAAPHVTDIELPSGVLTCRPDGWHRCRIKAADGELYCWNHTGAKKKDRLQAKRIARARKLLEDAGYQVTGP